MGAGSEGRGCLSGRPAIRVPVGREPEASGGVRVALGWRGLCSQLQTSLPSFLCSVRCRRPERYVAVSAGKGLGLSAFLSPPPSTPVPVERLKFLSVSAWGRRGVGGTPGIFRNSHRPLPVEGGKGQHTRADRSALPRVAQARKPACVRRLTQRLVCMSRWVPFHGPSARALLPLQFSLQSGLCAFGAPGTNRKGMALSVQGRALPGAALGTDWDKCPTRCSLGARCITPLSCHTAPVSGRPPSPWEHPESTAGLWPGLGCALACWARPRGRPQARLCGYQLVLRREPFQECRSLQSILQL